MAHDAILPSAADFYRRALPADGFPVSPLMVCRIQANGDVEVISPVDFYASPKPMSGHDYAKPARYLDATGYKGRK